MHQMHNSIMEFQWHDIKLNVLHENYASKGNTHTMYLIIMSIFTKNSSLLTPISVVRSKEFIQRNFFIFHFRNWIVWKWFSRKFLHKIVCSCFLSIGPLGIQAHCMRPLFSLFWLLFYYFRKKCLQNMFAVRCIFMSHNKSNVEI